jgi:hypothetical protein
MYEDILKIVEKYFGDIGCEDCECCAQEIAIKLSDPDAYAELFDEDEVKEIYAGNANGIFTNDDEVI